VDTDERTKDIGDRRPVFLGVRGDALQRSDPTYPHLGLFTAELIDGVGESVGNLSFATDVHLTPGRQGADHDQQSREALEQSGPGVVLQFGLGLLQLDAGAGVGNAAQIRSGQGRIEHFREQ